MAKIIKVPVDIEILDSETREFRIAECDIWVNPEHVSEIAPHPKPERRNRQSCLLLLNGRVRTACLPSEDLAQLLFPYGDHHQKPRVRYTNPKEAIGI